MKLKAFTLLSLLLIFSSCRKEESEFIETPEEEILEANSTTTDLIERTTSNDGSFDNIVDRANCFTINFPYTVNVNGESITVASNNDLANIECTFDASDSDTDTLVINFPITIVLDDYEEIEVNSISEFNTLTTNCNGENEADNDIECIDFEYPIEASTFNPNTESIETINLENDRELFAFVSELEDNLIVTMDFPIIMRSADNSEESINNFTDLETAIETAINTCDEDDDYDYNDDDCDNCTISEVENLLVNCTNWSVDKLERNGIDYDDVYEGYDFNFFSDGTMDVYWNSTSANGTWIASGSGNNLEIIINVPALPLCNANWILHEIDNCSDETKLDFRVGDDDRIRYENDCN